MKYRAVLIILIVASVLAPELVTDGTVAAAPKASLDLIKKLAIVPAQKPSYLALLDIEKYLKEPVGKPRWSNDLIPTILSASDVSRYRVIFRLQREGEWRIADKVIYSLKNPILIGHVLAQRYLHPKKYRSKYRELRAWMDNYRDQHEARRIYKLALKRRPTNWKMPKKPIVQARKFSGFYVRRANYLVYERQKNLSRNKRKEMLSYQRHLRFYLRKGWTLAFKKLINKNRVRELFHPWQLDRARAQLAAGYFAAGRDQWAIQWGEKAIRRSGKYLPEAHWTLGLSAWRLGKFRKSRDHFEEVSGSAYASSWLVSAGAFWASRASIKIRRPQDYTKYLKIAAQHPRTFYGLLASYILGKKVEYNWASPPLTKKAVSELAEQQGGRRAIALLQVGEDHLAEKELRIVFSTADPELAGAMLAISDRAEMPSLAMRLGNMLVASGLKLHDSTAYPAPTLLLDQSESVDRELILAIVRQESGFNPNAKSPRGARGLMQLMPGTASFVAQDRRYRGSKMKTLFDPNTNITLGQRYIDILFKDNLIKGDMFRMVMAWNAGPGKLNKWTRNVNYNNDPLLLIESIPAKETRIFVERVMANYWIYRSRFGQPLNSLGALAAGKWPLYPSDRPSTLELAADEVDAKQ